MTNAFFMTGLAVFFHIWGGAKLGGGIAKSTAGQFDSSVLGSMIGGALLAFIPFLVMGPTWITLDQPIILAVEMLILMAAIGFPMFVPIEYREKFFGTRTYWVWLGMGLFSPASICSFNPETWRNALACLRFSRACGFCGVEQPGYLDLEK